jgi:hypothetical protein
MPQFLDRNAKTERHRQTFHIHVMHAGGELRTDSNLMSNERPLWVKSGHDGVNFRCVLYPRKRTSELARVALGVVAPAGRDIRRDPPCHRIYYFDVSLVTALGINTI